MKAYKSFFSNSAIQLTDLAYSVYEGVLEEKNILDTAKNYDNKGKGSIGGQDGDAIEHFISRFQNSALRISYVSLNHKNEFDTISEWIKTTFSIGTVKFLDLCCGTGAGSVGLVSTILELRKQNNLADLPLNIEILGADYSEKSLEYFNNIMTRLKSQLSGTSICLSHVEKIWDAKCLTSSNALIDEFITDKNDEFFILINNFSGIASNSVEIQRTLECNIFPRFSNKKCTLVWLEPYNYKKAIRLFKKISEWFSNSLRKMFIKGKTNEGETEYQIYDRLSNKKKPSGVAVKSGRRGENEL